MRVFILSDGVPIVRTSILGERWTASVVDTPQYFTALLNILILSYGLCCSPSPLGLTIPHYRVSAKHFDRRYTGVLLFAHTFSCFLYVLLPSQPAWTGYTEPLVVIRSPSRPRILRIGELRIVAC